MATSGAGEAEGGQAARGPRSVAGSLQVERRVESGFKSRTRAAQDGSHQPCGATPVLL